MMNSENVINSILQWDVNSWSKAFHFWETQIEFNQISNALELGGREGGLSLWLALNQKHVVCSDLLNTQKTASALHQKYNVSEFVHYQDIDASKIPYENHFDLIVFKSIIGGIGRNNNSQIQQQVFQQIHRALKPGGKLLFAENLIASPLHQAFRKRFVKWGDSWRYVSLDELKLFLKDFSSVQIKSNGVLATFGRSENQRKFLSHLDNFLFNPIFPNSWKYIGYGVAVK